MVENSIEIPLNTANHELPVEPKKIDSGPDSEVWLSEKGTVIKKYIFLAKREEMPPEKIVEILQEYKQDTEKAAALLQEDPNPYDQSMSINGEAYPLRFIIVPQGDNISINEKGVVISAGQEYVAGDNLGYGFKLGIEDEHVYLPLILDEISSYLNDKLGTFFSLKAPNIKARVVKEEKVVYMYITDLANSLYRCYFERKPVNPPYDREETYDWEERKKLPYKNLTTQEQIRYMKERMG